MQRPEKKKTNPDLYDYQETVITGTDKYKYAFPVAHLYSLLIKVAFKTCHMLGR